VVLGSPFLAMYVVVEQLMTHRKERIIECLLGGVQVKALEPFSTAIVFLFISFS